MRGGCSGVSARKRKRAWCGSAMLVLLGFTPLVVGCHDRQHATDQAEAHTAVVVPSASATALRQPARGDQNEASPAVPDSCRDSEACKADGVCSSRSGACVAASANDCGRSLACKIAGACDLREGACQATRPEHCQRADHCKTSGLCTLDEEAGVCRNTNDADCRASSDCKARGRCASNGVWCVSTPEDCAASTRCRDHGECVVLTPGCYDPKAPPAPPSTD
jgi:hypothetical protein